MVSFFFSFETVGERRRRWLFITRNTLVHDFTAFFVACPVLVNSGQVMTASFTFSPRYSKHRQRVLKDLPPDLLGETICRVSESHRVLGLETL